MSPFLLPFAAGNFVYIAAADLVPQITSPVACATPVEHELMRREKLEQTPAFAAGLGALLALAIVA
jgi:zinc and cadmium transporter